LIPSSGKRLFSSVHSNKLWAPHSIPFNGTSPGVNWLGDEMTTQLQLVSRIKYMELYPYAPIHFQYHDKGLHLEFRAWQS